MKKTKSEMPNNKNVNNTDNCQLILYNDDVNSFDFVIETLISVCDHNPEQAEQCTLIAHFKGKCQILVGTISELRPVFDEISRRGLTVEIQ